MVEKAKINTVINGQSSVNIKTNWPYNSQIHSQNKSVYNRCGGGGRVAEVGGGVGRSHG